MNIGYFVFLFIVFFLSFILFLVGEFFVVYCLIICFLDSSDDDYLICDILVVFLFLFFGCSGFFLIYEQGVVNFGFIDFFGDFVLVGVVGVVVNVMSYNS